MTEALRVRLCAAALLAFAAVAYGGSFSGPFVYDDLPAIVENSTLRHLSTVFFPPENTTATGRPLLNLSLALNWAWTGRSVWSYHVVNLLIHAGAALVLFGLVRWTLRSTRLAGSALSCAFAAALIWEVHPLTTGAVTYIVQRAESLMALFYLLTLYCFARWRAGGTIWAVFSALACLLGMLTKETMVSAPLAVLLYDRAFVAGSMAGALKARKGYYFALAGTWLPFLILAHSAGGRTGTVGAGAGVSPLAYLLTQGPALCHNLRLAIWPRRLIFSYGPLLASPSAGTLLRCGVVIAALALSLGLLIRRPKIGFVAACFFLILAPSSSFVPIATETAAEHRMYLPLAVLAVLLVAAGARFFRSSVVVAVSCLAAVVLTAGTISRNRIYRTSESLWADTAAKLPANPHAWSNLGLAEFEMGKREKALDDYLESLRREPNQPDVEYDAGTVLAELGRPEDAVSHFSRALALKPQYAAAKSNLAKTRYDWGISLGHQGRDSDAIEQYRLALAVDPSFVLAHNNLGILYAKGGRLAEAIGEFREAVRLAPGFAPARRNLQLAEQSAAGK